MVSQVSGSVLVASVPNRGVGPRRSAQMSALVCVPPHGPALVTEQLGLNEMPQFRSCEGK